MTVLAILSLVSLAIGVAAGGVRLYRQVLEAAHETLDFKEHLREHRDGKPWTRTRAGEQPSSPSRRTLAATTTGAGDLSAPPTASGRPVLRDS